MLAIYYITKSIIEDDGNIKEFIIEQLKINTFKIMYVSDTDLSQDKINNIQKEMEIYLEKGLQIILRNRF